MGVPMDTAVPISSLLPGVISTCANEDFTFVEDLDDPDRENARVGINGTRDPVHLAEGRCWKVVWMWSVLHKGLRFPLDIPQITFALTLDGTQASWAMGAM